MHRCKLQELREETNSKINKALEGLNDVYNTLNLPGAEELSGELVIKIYREEEQDSFKKLINNKENK
tara:strand:- start:99 stop:299 length:201 start_codon:yes stop_codon:yes gene_type:complete